jgi:hypothetical protein
MYPKYRIDKEKGKFVVRKFTGFDHSWAEYSKPLEIFDTEKEAQVYIGDIILTAQPTQDPKHPTIQEQNPHIFTPATKPLSDTKTLDEAENE